MEIGTGVLLYLWILAVSGQEACLVEDDVRLVRTLTLTTENSGRLEICRGGVWGTVRSPSATGFWSTKNVQVACRQMGQFIAGLNSVPSISQISVSPNIPVHVRDVICDGTEQSLTECQFSVAGVSTHSTDVYIVCLPGSELYSGLNSLGSGSVTEGDLRLIGSVANGEGAVEIYSQLGWTTICPDSEWSNSDADVICQRLGYDSGTSEIFTLEAGVVAPRSVRDSQCTGLPSGAAAALRVSAGFCSFLGSTDITCSQPPNQYAGVRCTTSSPDQTVRAFNRISVDDMVTAIMEVVIDGRWGLFCRPVDVSEVAESTCQGLGFGRDQARILSITNLQSVESRQKPVWIPDVTCTPESEGLDDCSYQPPLGYGACQEVLAVACVDPGYMLPGYGTALIVISVLAVVGLVVFWLTKGQYMWKNRTSYSNYNKLMNCLGACNCRESCQRRPRSRRTQGSATVQTTQPTSAPEPTPAPAPVQVTPPEPEPEPAGNSELTNPPPPSYGASANFPEPREELPPPYSGPSSHFLSGAAYPPPTNPTFPPDKQPEKGQLPPPGHVGAYPPPDGAAAAFPPVAPYPPPSADIYPPPGNAAYPPPGAYPPTENTPYPPS